MVFVHVLTGMITEDPRAIQPSDSGPVAVCPSDSDHDKFRELLVYWKNEFGEADARGRAVRDMLQICQDAHRQIGRVYASSGLRTCREGYIQD